MATKVVLRGGPFDGRELNIRTESDTIETERIAIGQSLTKISPSITATYVKTDELIGDRTVFIVKEEESNE